MAKKLLSILIATVLAVSCMMVPTFADNPMTWELSSTGSTIIEMEHFFYGINENPVSIPEIDTSTKKQWLANNNANNGYLYSIGWEVDNETHIFNVNSPTAQYYDVEFVAGDKSDMSEISIYVGDTLVADTHENEGEELYKLDDTTSIRKYSRINIPLNAGSNTVRVCTTKQYSDKNYRNAYVMDYIKFTPAGVDVPFAVSAIEDNTVDAACISIVFSKPVADAKGITVTAQEGTAKIDVDAENANKVKITGIAGRTTITVPADFTDATGSSSLAEAYSTTVFAYPVTGFANKSEYNYNAETGTVSAKFSAEPGMWREQSATRKIKCVIALYDGDKMVAVNQKDFNLPGSNSISASLGEGVKFTEAKLFGFFVIKDEWIPIDKASNITAASLGITLK